MISFWDSRPYGLDFAPVAAAATREAVAAPVIAALPEPENQLAVPQELATSAACREVQALLRLEQIDTLIH